jgi:hypothetical protein
MAVGRSDPDHHPARPVLALMPFAQALGKGARRLDGGGGTVAMGGFFAGRLRLRWNSSIATRSISATPRAVFRRGRLPWHLYRQLDLS